MRAMLLRFMCLVFATSLAAPPLLAQAQGQAQTLSRTDEKNIRAVVQSQLDAFAADDSKKAFSYATPGIQKVMGNAERFMAVVQSSYPMVYRPASVAFLKPELATGDIIQRLQITDSDGSQWLAVYRMELQKNKTWRIGGCVVRPDVRQSA